MSMGPLDTSRPWSTKDVVGAHRFLQRLWRTVVDEETGAVRVTDATPDDATTRLLHRTISGVSADYAALRSNTAASKLIELTNHLTKVFPDGAPRSVVEPLVLMLAPLAPHVAEELWSRLGHGGVEDGAVEAGGGEDGVGDGAVDGGGSLAHGPFPVAQQQWLTADTVDYPIQVNGKVRSKITVAADASREDVQAAALADPKVVELLAGAAPKKVIVVPGRLVNLVV
jgi:leucyl-tRNA synthetase